MMFTRFMSKALLASVAAGVATLALAPAHAELGAPRSMEVRYSDLDLSSDAGKARFKKRISYAATVVCGPADENSYTSRKLVGECQDRTIANASDAMVTVIASKQGQVRVAAN